MTHPPRVIKIGGRPQGDASLPALVARAWRESSRALVLVHGGGDEVSALQRALGATPTFVGGRRVTSEGDIETLRMALSGSANKRLVARLVAHGVPALGLSGEDAALLEATPLDAERYGHVGAPRRVNVDLLWHLLDGGYLPVLSPLAAGLDEEGGPSVPTPTRALAAVGAVAPAAPAGEGRAPVALNVNGDDAAAAIAVALAAEELLLVSDVPGLLAGGRVVDRLDPDGARRLVADGTAAGGMAAKLQAALHALDGGVARVRIADLAAVADATRGTILTRTLVESHA